MRNEINQAPPTKTTKKQKIIRNYTIHFNPTSVRVHVRPKDYVKGYHRCPIVAVNECVMQVMKLAPSSRLVVSIVPSYRRDICMELVHKKMKWVNLKEKGYKGATVIE